MGNASAIGGRGDRSMEFSNTCGAHGHHIITKVDIAIDRRAIGIKGNVATAKDG